MSKVNVFIQFQLVMMASAPSEQNRKRGRRLTKKASLTAVFTWTSAHWLSFGAGERVEKTGRSRRAKIIRRVEDIIRGVGCIAFTWSCTKSFWFLRPTDALLSFESPREHRNSTEGTRGSSLRCWQASLGG